jgi:hypothetical protein
MRAYEPTEGLEEADSRFTQLLSKTPTMLEGSPDLTWNLIYLHRKDTFCLKTRPGSLFVQGTYRLVVLGLVIVIVLYILGVIILHRVPVHCLEILSFSASWRILSTVFVVSPPSPRLRQIALLGF